MSNMNSNFPNALPSMTMANFQDNYNYEVKDALIYSSIYNMITPDNFMNKDARNWNKDKDQKPISSTSKLDGYANFTNSIGIISGDQNAQMQTLLSNTTLRRACCLKDVDTENEDYYKVNVKLPYVANEVSDFDINKHKLYEPNGFMFKEIRIPISMCENSWIGPNANDGQTHTCDKFYKLYCENVKLAYNKNSKYDSNKLHEYAPDCSCLMDTPESLTNVQPACYALNCLTGGSSVYRDRETREKGPCTVNQCTAIINMGDMIASSEGKINQQTQVNQTCGEFRDSSVNRGAKGAAEDNEYLKSLLNDTKPGDTKPGDTKPGDTKPGNTKPGDNNSGDNNPDDTKPTTTKPGNNQYKIYLYGSISIVIFLCICSIIIIVYFIMTKKK